MQFILAFFFTLVALGCGLFYLFIGKHAMNISGGSIASERIQENYNNFHSFFQNPKEIEKAEKVPDFVDTFYNLVTDFYEAGWGQSFHFAPSIPGKSHRESMRLHEVMAADLIDAKQGEKILDVGCGVGGPMRSIAAHSHANVVGITINDYQVKRAKLHNKKAGVEGMCEVLCGNFLQMPFKDNSFSGAYSISATCHAPNLEEVYGEIFRVLKPGALYVSYEWVTTGKYNPENNEHVEIIQGIEIGDAIPGLRSYTDISLTAKKVGFEVVKENDLAAPRAGPWWTKLNTGFYASWNYVVMSALARIGIVPKGSVDVTKMLVKTISYLSRGGETGIFTPTYMILCRKPHVSSN